MCVCYNNTLFAKVIIHSLFPRVLFSFVFPKKGKKKCRHKTPLVLRYSARQRPNKQTVSSPRVRLTHVFFPLRPPSQSSPHGERRDAARLQDGQIDELAAPAAPADLANSSARRTAARRAVADARADAATSLPRPDRQRRLQTTNRVHRRLRRVPPRQK